MTEIQTIIISSTDKTPDIDFNALSGELILSGRSIPENSAKVYEPLLLWIIEYIKEPRPVTNLRLQLDYYNSASFIWIAKIIKALSTISLKDSLLMIHLYFDIEDFDDMEIDDLKDIVGSLIDNVTNSNISIGIKTYGTDENGKTIKESTILI
jgi:hypothetical protein